MRRTPVFRLTNVRIGLAILAVYAMLGMGFVEAVMRSATVSQPTAVGVLCSSDRATNPGDPPAHRSGHGGWPLCSLLCFDLVAFTPRAPVTPLPPRWVSIDEPSRKFALFFLPSPRGREGAPVRGPPAASFIA